MQQVSRWPMQPACGPFLVILPVTLPSKDSCPGAAYQPRKQGFWADLV